MTKSAKVLVTGGAGYIGSHMVLALLDAGYSPLILDNFSTGHYKNIAHIVDNTNFTFIDGDIRDFNVCQEVTKYVDVVLHQAALGSVPRSIKDPRTTNDVNVSGFLNIMEASRQNGVERFIYASSSSVYGIKEEESVTEDLKAEPITDYSKFKLECENILLNHEGNFHKTIIRPATVCGYSERQRLDVIVNILTNHAYFNKKIIIHGGEQLRPNIHIDDMSESYIHVINNSKISDNEIFNVGDENHSVSKLAEMVKEACPYAELIKEKVIDQRSYKISSEKIYNKIGFKTRKTIKDAIDDLVKAFSEKKLFNSFENEEFYNIKIIKKKLKLLLND